MAIKSALFSLSHLYICIQELISRSPTVYADAVGTLFKKEKRQLALLQFGGYLQQYTILPLKYLCMKSICNRDMDLTKLQSLLPSDIIEQLQLYMEYVNCVYSKNILNTPDVLHAMYSSMLMNIHSATSDELPPINDFSFDGYSYNDIFVYDGVVFQLVE